MPPSERRVYQGVIQPRHFPGLPGDWTSDWETFPSSDGKLQLYAVTHHSKEWRGHRALVILHGFSEHGGRYLHFPHYLKSTVDAVYCLDHRGHGRSEGLRGHTERFDLFTDDVALAISRLDDHLKKRFGQSEIHVLGHSMGGLIALRTLIKHSHLPIQSVSVSAPALGIKVEIPQMRKLAALALSKIWGAIHMGADFDARKLSHDQDVIEAFVSDRLVHHKVTPRFFLEMQWAMEDTLGRDRGFDTPLQMLVPLQDSVCDAEVSLRFFRDLKMRDKGLKTYPGLFHEPFNEIGKDQVFEDFALWIKDHSIDSSLR